MSFKKVLEDLEACRSALEWVGDRTEEQAWAECTRPDWMFWHLNMKGEITVELAIALAEWALRFVPEGEPRPREAIALARMCSGEHSETLELAAYRAADAAYDFAYSGSGDDAAATNAGYAASWAVRAAVAASAALKGAAALASVKSASFASWAAGAGADIELCDQIRTLVGAAK